MIKVLCIGEEWKGSNASGLFYALARIGCVTSIVNELKYISVSATSLLAKGVNRVVRQFQVSDFNSQIISIANRFSPDVILVYKGAFVKAATIAQLKVSGFPVVNFFPDVSFLTHGSNIPLCVPLYDHIFTTKTFGAGDLYKGFGYPVDRVTFIPHAFDPLVHFPYRAASDSSFACDASFIGNYSAHKGSFLDGLKERLPNLELKIWGGTWGNHNHRFLQGAVQGLGIHGDLYAFAINASKINIALLSERVTGASKGDQITSRTFHIPASGGFMLHQRTEELFEYFDEGEDVACFESIDELVDKVTYYLARDSERAAIQEKGYAKTVSKHSLDQRAHTILSILKDKQIV